MNIMLAKEKTWKKKLAHFCVRRKFIIVSFYQAQLCVNSTLDTLKHNSI